MAASFARTALDLSSPARTPRRLAALLSPAKRLVPALTSEMKGDVDVTTLAMDAAGSIYLPNQTMRIWGSGSTTVGGADAKLVARRIEAGGNAKLTVSSDDID